MWVDPPPPQAEAGRAAGGYQPAAPLRLQAWHLQWNACGRSAACRPREPGCPPGSTLPPRRCRPGRPAQPPLPQPLPAQPRCQPDWAGSLVGGRLEPRLGARRTRGRVGGSLHAGQVGPAARRVSQARPTRQRGRSEPALSKRLLSCGACTVAQVARMRACGTQPWAQVTPAAALLTGTHSGQQRWSERPDAAPSQSRCPPGSSRLSSAWHCASIVSRAAAATSAAAAGEMGGSGAAVGRHWQQWQAKHRCCMRAG